jgi:hypothetical protein
MAMMAMTTRSSMRVKAFREERREREGEGVREVMEIKKLYSVEGEVPRNMRVPG